MPSIPELMTSNLHRVFGERDETKRLAAIADTYAAGVTFSDPEGVTVGHDTLAAKVTALLAGAPGFVFAETSPVYVVQDLGYLAWQFGPEGQPPVATGVDIGIAKDGLLVTLHTVVTSAGEGSGAE